MGAAFYTRSLSEDWKLGASLIALSGAVLDYDDDWVGRYECQETSILIATLTPSIAYRIDEQWLVQGGIAHDTSPVNSSARTADMPVDKQFRLSVGVEQKRSDKVTLGLIFQYTDLGDSKIRSYYAGDYKKNEVFSLAFNINWK